MFDAATPGERFLEGLSVFVCGPMTSARFLPFSELVGLAGKIKEAAVGCKHHCHDQCSGLLCDSCVPCVRQDMIKRVRRTRERNDTGKERYSQLKTLIGKTFMEKRQTSSNQ